MVVDDFYADEFVPCLQQFAASSLAAKANFI
jgi:hypothetical protein